MTENNLEAERLMGLLSDRAIATETFTPDDWQSILALAEKHSVAPQLYSCLSERKLTLPPAVTQQLRMRFLFNRKRSTYFRFELRRVLLEFQAANISVIPLKGAYLAEGVYGDPAKRYIGDLDLLVKTADLNKALDILERLGFFSNEPFDIESERQLSQHLPHSANAEDVRVELHWTIVSPWLDIPFDNKELEALWKRAMPITLCGVNVLMLSPAYLLLHLCTHASVQHHFDGIGLRCFWDMALVIRRFGTELDWKQFAARANEWGIANGVKLTLLLVQEWTDTPIPDFVMQSLRAASPGLETIEIVKQRILTGGSDATDFDVAGTVGKADIGDVIRSLRHTLFPSRVVLAEQYHVSADSWRILFYYPIRFKDLLVRNPWAFRHFLARDKKLLKMQQELELREYLD